MYQNSLEVLQAPALKSCGAIECMIGFIHIGILRPPPFKANKSVQPELGNGWGVIPDTCGSLLNSGNLDFLVVWDRVAVISGKIGF